MKALHTSLAGLIGPLDWLPCHHCGAVVGLREAHTCVAVITTVGYGGIVYQPPARAAAQEASRHRWNPRSRI